MTKPPTDEDIVRLARQAGLDLPAEFMPELIEAYGHVRQMVERVSVSSTGDSSRLARRRDASAMVRKARSDTASPSLA